MDWFFKMSFFFLLIATILVHLCENSPIDLNQKEKINFEINFMCNRNNFNEHKSICYFNLKVNSISVLYHGNISFNCIQQLENTFMFTTKIELEIPITVKNLLLNPDYEEAFIKILQEYFLEHKHDFIHSFFKYFDCIGSQVLFLESSYSGNVFDILFQ